MNFETIQAVEKVKLAAVRLGEEVFTGQMHFMAMEKAKATLSNFAELEPTMEQGFITTLGRFISRDEAGKLADEAGQLDHLSEQEHDSAVGRLDSHNISGLKKLDEDFDT